ncbi:MAG TPA: glycosyltransferase family 1 protein [Thermoanaerobaculia bacterium]|nr:glycosyltransferase family 1 protein [Thermoanaerobaculia bacterium]
MRIGIDASNLRAGGGVTHIAELLRHADPARHGVSEVTIWSGRSTLAQIDERPWLRREHDPLLDGALPQRAFWQRARLPRLARAACDVLFVPGGNSSGVHPYVTMAQNLLPFDPPERARYKYSRIYFRLVGLRALQARTFRRADSVIFPSEYALEKIGPAIGLARDRSAVIPHGVNELFRSEPRPQRALASYSMSAPFRFLYTSIIDLYKHQWNVAEAVVRMRRAGMPVALDLVGPAYPPAMAKVEKVLERAGEHRAAVRFRGPAEHAETVNAYHDADAFVFASTCESISLILIEAMAAGLPIACSNRRPMLDVLQQAGLYFDAESVDSIEKALRALALDPAVRAACGKSVYDLALQYSWRRCADETFSLLARVGTRQ